MTFRIRINDIAVIDRLTAAVRRIGETADGIGRAAQSIADAADSAKVRRRLNWWGSAAWADLLGGLTKAKKGY